MTHSPIKHGSHLTTATTDQQLRSPRSTRGLRKLQSAHQLSSNYAALNAPSLISQQRHQQQQQQQQQQQRNVSSQAPQIPPLPAFSSHHRTRSNSDAVAPNNSTNTALRRQAAPKKVVSSQSPREELESLVRQGPQGSLPAELSRLRHLVLCEGLHSDSDGMVGTTYGKILQAAY